MTDGQGHVAARVRLSASRPDGRTMGGPQVMLVTVEDGRVRAIDSSSATLRPWPPSGPDRS